ncbi:MAG: helix-turn-helix domain-containing protein [Promethearchaeia archaeon]
MNNNIIGYCSYHGYNINEKEFEYKGCWNCHYFEKKNSFPYYNVKEASEILKVSRNTIINWIKKGKLNAKLFIQQRRRGISTWRIYYIEKESIHKFL